MIKEERKNSGTGTATLLFAIACGMLVANIYYIQPIAGIVANTIGLPLSASGLLVTLTQVGYGFGLLFVVPLGDLLENRKLIVTVIIVAAVALTGIGLSTAAWIVLTLSFVVGVGAVATQVLLPFASHLAPEKERGRVVGNVSSGLLVGVMLARPLSSFVTIASSWHVIFLISAAAMCVLVVLLVRGLPKRLPTASLTYVALIRTLPQLFQNQPVLRRRAAYQACLFFSFSLFWTTVPFVLSGPPFHFTQFEIGLFALAGVAGALAAPLAGRLADRGLSRPATLYSIAAVTLAFVVAPLSDATGPGILVSLGVMLVTAVLLDFGVQANNVLGFRAIYSLSVDLRMRLNGLYLAIFFAAGAIGSAVGAWAYSWGGWHASAFIGLIPPCAATVYALTEYRHHS